MSSSNFKARQSLNNKYQEIKGALSINEVAEGFSKGWIIFAIFSALASAFSFYQDFNKSLGVIITILLAVVLASALEFFKHLSIRGMFSDMNFASKSLISSLAVGLISVSFYTHYKSVLTFQKNLVNDDLKTEIAYQRDLQKVQNGQFNEILKSNTALSKALDNGSKTDDIPSADTVQSNNNLIITLSKLSTQNNMNNTALILKESRSAAQTTASAILIIFIMIEIMALFSIVSKIIIVDNVDKGLKDFVEVADKLDQLEANVYSDAIEQKTAQTTARIESKKAQQNRDHQKELIAIGYTPTLPQGTDTEKAQTPPIYPQIGFNGASASNAYFMGIENQNKPYINKGVNLPSVNTSNPYFMGAMHQTKEPKEETHNKKEHFGNFAEEKVIADLLKFNHKEQQIMFEMWENGAVKKGDKLVSKRLVKLSLKEERLITHNEIDTLYAKLEEMGIIVFKNGYRAKAEIENIVKSS